ncbi:MAG: hypothetical protein IPK80_27555 [Nannocystis sp.]|nr:hypothetical protein [Nannocystis sp.]
MSGGGAPLYEQTLALAAAIEGALAGEDEHPGLAAGVLQGALALVDRVALAVAGIERARSLAAADAALCTLRARLDLALRCGLWEDAVHLAAAEQTEAIGRQIGGWLRSLDRGPRGHESRG